MKKLVVSFLVFLTFFQSVFAQSLPVSNMQNAVSGVIQQKMLSRGFASNDPRWVSTLQGAGASIVGAAGAAALVTAAGVTAPAWVTAGAMIGLGALLSAGINLAIDATVNWKSNSDGSVTVVPPPGSATSGITSKTAWTGAYGWSYAIWSSNPMEIIKFVGSQSNSGGAGATFQNCQTISGTRYNCAVYSSTGAAKGGVDAYIGTMSDSDFSKASGCAGIYYGTCQASSLPPSQGAPTTNTPSNQAANVSAADKAKTLDPALIAAIANEAVTQAAAQSGYSGVPNDFYNPITKADVEKWFAGNPANVPKVGDLLAPQPLANSPFSLPSGPPATLQNPLAQTGTSINPASSSPQVNLGSDPGIGAPSLESTPTANSILAPIFNLFPSLRSYVVPSHSSQCPVASFDAFNKHFVMDSHCTLAENIRVPAAAIMSAVWLIISVFIILAA